MSDFDPADATVNEVMDYVDEHPDELEAVLEAERDGKNRTSLTDRLEARQDAELRAAGEVGDTTDEGTEETPTPGVDDGVLAETAAKEINAAAEQAGLEAAKQREIETLRQSGTDSLDAQIAAKEAELDALKEAREDA